MPLTATFGTKQEAMGWAHQTEAQVLKTPKQHSRTIGEAIDRYITAVVPQKVAYFKTSGSLCLGDELPFLVPLPLL